MESAWGRGSTSMESAWGFSVVSLDLLRNCRVETPGRTFSLTTGFAGPCRTCFSEAVPFCLAKVLPGFWTGALLSLERSPALFDPAALLPRSPITVRVLRPIVVDLPRRAFLALAPTELFSEFWLWRFNCVALKPAIFLVFVELCSPLVEVVVSLTNMEASFSLQSTLAEKF